jgi:hypothetical protein
VVPVFLACFVAVPVWSIPQEVTITGYLTEAQGDPPIDVPVTGSFPMQVTFVEDVQEFNEVAVVDCTAEVEQGILNTTLALPDAVLVLEEVWYLVAIDVDGDGFDESDQFGTPMRLTSVPYALSGKPLTYYESHVGQSGAMGWGPNVKGRVYLAPFSAPPGGVRFNRMAASFEFEANDDTSFGVYDFEGNLLYSSPLLNGAQPVGVLAFDIEGRLQPSQIYYTALTSNGDRRPRVGMIMLPTMPTLGFYDSGKLDGRLPDKIDIENIVFSDENHRPLSIAFYNVEDGTASKALGKNLGKGIRYDPSK